MANIFFKKIKKSYPKVLSLNKTIKVFFVDTLNVFIQYFKYFKRTILKRIYKINILRISFSLDAFKNFSLLYFFITFLLIVISYKYNTFDLIDMSNFFLTIWWMLWSILALCITIHFFYVQNFSNYSALIFIADVNNSKKNYMILWIIWTLTIFFFFLWWNFNILINKCPDYFLLPLSLCFVAIALRLVVYYFYHITKRLSPKGMLEEIEKYFKNTLKILKKFQKFENNYAKYLWIETKKQFLLTYWNSYNKVWRYKLEAMCDNYKKLLNLNENRLSQDFLFSIENCFSYLIQSYWIVSSSIELEYLTDTTEVDKEINRFFDKIESLMVINIQKNDIEWMLRTFWLYVNMMVKTFYINYSDFEWREKTQKILFFNLIMKWQSFFKKLLSLNNEEAFFQRKEGIITIISTILNDLNNPPDTIYRVEWLLEYVNYLNLWVIQKGREDIFKLHNIYSQLYLSLVNNNSIIDKDNVDTLDNLLYEFLGDSSKNIDNLIQSIRNTLSFNINILLQNIRKDKKYIENIFFFINSIYRIIYKISQKKWLQYWNWIWLLIEQLWLLYFHIKTIEGVDSQLFIMSLHKVLDIVDLVINNKDKLFPKNFFSWNKIYDQLWWIWIYAKRSKNDDLFEKCFDILSNNIINIMTKENIHNLWNIKYFCYWLFIEDAEKYERYFEVFSNFFRIELKKYKEEHIKYWKENIIRIINEVRWCFDLANIHISSSVLSEKLLIDYGKITIENQEKIMMLILAYCKNIYN